MKKITFFERVWVFVCMKMKCSWEAENEIFLCRHGSEEFPSFHRAQNHEQMEGETW